MPCLTYLKMLTTLALCAQQTGGEADDVLAERGKQWGNAYKQISGDWDELLGIKTTTEEFIAMMIVLKLRRWRNSGYTEKDCLTDIIGYAKLALN